MLQELHNLQQPEKGKRMFTKECKPSSNQTKCIYQGCRGVVTKKYFICLSICNALHSFFSKCGQLLLTVLELLIIKSIALSNK